MKLKKFLTVAMSSFVLVSMLSVQVFGANIPSAERGEPTPGDVSVTTRSRFISSDEVANGALPARQEDMDIDINLDEVKPFSRTSNIQSRTASWNALPGTYNYFDQINNYYCGPASVQAALRYLTGYTIAQSTIAQGTNTTTSGTYLSNMITYLNSQQSNNYYVGVYQGSQQTMKDALYSGVASYAAPPIIGLSFSTSDGWAFNSGGHFISIYATMSDKSAFMLADPWIGYAGLSGNSYYSKSDTALYKAYSAKNLGLAY